MARISIDPTQEKNKPRFFNFRMKFRWPPHQAFGVLCAFWGKVAESEANESGEISDWSPEYVADQIGLDNVKPNDLWNALELGYIDKRGDRFFVADWLEIIGPHLKKKYHNNREELKRIWALNRQDLDRSYPELKSSDSVLGQKDAKNSGISTPEIVVSPTPPSSEDLEAYIPSRASVGFTNSPPTEKQTAPVSILQKLFLTRLASHYETTEEKVRATFNYGAAGNGFKKLLGSGYTVQEVEALFDPWVRSTDSFITKRGHRIEDFFSYVTPLRNGPIANQVGMNGRKPSNWLAAAGTETEREFKD